MVKFIPANQNQPDKTTDIVIDTNKTICPEFDLPKLTCDYSHVLSIDETETYLSFNVSLELTLFHMGGGGRFCPPSDCLYNFH